MFNNDYENYMRSVLGYPIQNEMNTYNNVYGNNNSCFPYRSGSTYVTENRYENLYPDIYRILKPMIKKICASSGNGDISNDSLENMATEIYNNIESEINVVNVNITTTKEAENTKASVNYRNNTKGSQTQSKTEETRTCCGNPTLRDLIKILILNQLLENNNNRPPRPPRPPFQPFFMQQQPYRELESPAIYNSNYSSNQSYQYYN